MDFGRVPVNQLKKIDFSLPKEPAENSKVLKGKRSLHPSVYIGCAKWGRKEWVGKIYPHGTSEKNFLEHYVQHYNSIELNATTYKMPTPTQVKSWAEKAGTKEFIFCPKLVKYIIPNGNLERELEFTTTYLKAVKEFGKHLGPNFFMLPETYAPLKKEKLVDYLKSFPSREPLFVEFRHPGWFSDKKIQKEMFDFLRKFKYGTIITDTAGRRDCCHMHLTVPKAFVRFVGNSLHATDYSRLDEWVKRIKTWIDKGLEELYFFMHMHDEAMSPELTVYLVDKLNKECKLDIIRPTFVKS
jgi:uncharacterized protein YecE (DUF72 family)